MYDLIFDFIYYELLASTLTGHLLEELAILLSHTSIVLIYILMVRLILWFFNVFGGLTKW